MCSAYWINSNKNSAISRTGVFIIVIHLLELLQCTLILKSMLLSETNRKLY